MEGVALAWTGASVWESGEVLAQLLPSLVHLVEKKRVLELGAGCGLVGLTAAALGARETHLTDEVVHMAQFNLDQAVWGSAWEAAREAGMADGAVLQGSGKLSTQAQSGLRRAKVSELSWGDAQSVEAFDPPLDLLLGADLLYKHNTHAALADTSTPQSTIPPQTTWLRGTHLTDCLFRSVSALSGPDTIVLLVTPARKYTMHQLPPPQLHSRDVQRVIACTAASSPFFLRMRKFGFQITDISTEPEASAAIRAVTKPLALLARCFLSLLCEVAQCPVSVLDRVSGPRVLRMERLSSVSASLQAVSVDGRLEAVAIT